MDPIRGQKKRKVDKKMEPSNIASESSEMASADWFDALAKKIASMFNLTCVISSNILTLLWFIGFYFYFFLSM